jgi:hypothetical protein
MRATQSALEVYLAKPTAENNKALGIARDDMESTKDWTLKEVEELKKQSHQAEQIPILA